MFNRTCARDPIPEDGGFSRRERTIVGAILMLVSAFTALDVYEDSLEGAPLSHIIPEVLVIITLASVALYLGAYFVRTHQLSMRTAEAEISRVRGLAAQWQSEAEALRTGVSEAINQQLVRWGLSDAEQEIAFLLLKGLSIEEVAQIRTTSDRTVRQQASSIYKKSGLSGRAQLAAFFLEDLFDQNGSKIIRLTRSRR